MKQIVSKFILKLFGWKVAGQLPALKKYVAIVVPHTSSWDFIIGVLAKWSLNINVKFFGKKELFDSPLGFIFRALGGIPVDRFKNHNVVTQAVDEINKSDDFILVLSPEGTRQYVPEWRKGFYFIAMGANIPLLLCYIDYAQKEVGIGPLFYPTGNYAKDFEQIKDFYRDKKGKYPELGVH